MSFTIIAIVSAVIVFIATGLFGGNWGKFKLNRLQFLTIIPVACVLTSFIAIIPANTVGIQYSPFGGVITQTLSEGIQIKGLFDRVYQISTEVQNVQLNAITAQTKDSQYVDISVQIRYQVDKSTAFDVFSNYRTLDNVNQSFISNIVQRSIEDITTQYNVFQILGESKSEVYNLIELELAPKFDDAGLYFIGINFTDVEAGTAIEDAIREHGIATQSVETAKKNQEAAIIDAETDVEVARKIAEANGIISDSLTDEILRQQYIEAISNWRPSIIGANESQVIYNIDE